ARDREEVGVGAAWGGRHLQRSRSSADARRTTVRRTSGLVEGRGGGASLPQAVSSRAQAAVFDAVRPLGLGAEPAAAVGLVVLVVALEPDDAALALEGEDVGGDAVEEPAVVADDDRAAREVDERVLERAQRVDVEVVG